MSLQMCVPGNRSLIWAVTLLGRLSSPRLNTITLSIMVDNMFDLRSLDSECAVRALSHARFVDLRAVDWERLESNLSQPHFERLQIFELEGVGEAQLLDMWIQQRCPELHARGVMRFKPVEYVLSAGRLVILCRWLTSLGCLDPRIFSTCDLPLVWAGR